MKKTTLAGVVAAVVLVVPAAGACSAVDGDSETTDSETTERGTCGNATYKLSADDDDGGVEVTFELQSAAPGETWQVLIEQDGTEVFSETRQTDQDAEIDVDVDVSSTDGSTFTATATPENGAACTASLDR